MDPENKPTPPNSSTNMAPEPIPTIKGSRLDLFNKHASKVEGGPKPQEQKAVESPVEGQEHKQVSKPSEPAQEPLKPVSEQKPPQPKSPFVKNKIAENEDLKKKNEELLAEATRLREQEIPTLNTKIQELESKLSDGGSKKQEAEWQKEIDSLREEKQAREEDLLKRLEERESKLAFYDVQQMPQFKEQYEAPRDNLRAQIVKIIGNDKIADFNKILNAHFATLTNDPNQEMVRDELAQALWEQLPPMKQHQFSAAITDLYGKEENYVRALADHKATQKRLQEEQHRAAQDNQAKMIKQWRDSYESTASELDEIHKYSEEVSKVIKDQKIEDDITLDTQIAKSAWGEGQQYTPKDMTRILNQGRVYNKLVAINKAQESIIADLQETIKRQQGSSTVGGAVNQVNLSESKPEVKNRAAFMARAQALSQSRR